MTQKFAHFSQQISSLFRSSEAAPCVRYETSTERKKNIIPPPPFRRMSFRIFDPLIPSTRPPARLTSRGEGGGRTRTHSAIRRRDGFTSWLVALLRDAEIEFIIRRCYYYRRRVCSGLIESNRTIIEPDRLLSRDPQTRPGGDVVKRVTRGRFAAFAANENFSDAPR